MNEENKYVKMVQQSKGKKISRAKAIRFKCLDCCGYQSNEVRLCPSTDCPLWRYRTGHEEKDDLYSGKKETDDTNI